jgi:hypothetical protein
MKNLLAIFFFMHPFSAFAQRTMFSGQNNYVVPVAPAIVPTNNLILNLNASAYAGTGSAWNDASTQNNSATLVGNPTYTSSPASFTFGPNIVATTSKSNIALSAATFVAWVNPSQTQGGYTGIIFSRNGFGGSTVPATGLDLYNSNSVGYHWADNVSTYNWNSNLFVPNNEWSMTVVTVSSTTATAYLCNASGIATASNTVTHAALSGLNFFIACDPADRATRAFTGKIATAMVYSNALTQTDITNIFNAQKSAFGL